MCDHYRTKQKLLGTLYTSDYSLSLMCIKRGILPPLPSFWLNPTRRNCMIKDYPKHDTLKGRRERCPSLCDADLVTTRVCLAKYVFGNYKDQLFTILLNQRNDYFCFNNHLFALKDSYKLQENVSFLLNFHQDAFHFIVK